MSPNTNATNQIALVSFLLSLVFPVVMLCNFSPVGPYALLNVPTPPTELGTVVVAANYLGFGAIVGTILTGHLALDRAKRLPPQQALRGYAITGLVIGYVSLALSLAVVASVAVWSVVSFFLGGGLPNG